MKRTPALGAAAAALGLLAGLGLEARASTLRGEVSPHTVSVAWLTPGPFPAGVEPHAGGVIPPSAAAKKKPVRLAPMRAVAPARARVERKEQVHAHQKVLARHGCTRESHAAQADRRRS